MGSSASGLLRKVADHDSSRHRLVSASSPCSAYVPTLSSLNDGLGLVKWNKPFPQASFGWSVYHSNRKQSKAGTILKGTHFGGGGVGREKVVGVEVLALAEKLGKEP